MDADARERRGRSRTRRSIETTAAAAANEEEVDIEFDRTIALGSSGWLFIYYVGVIKVLRRNGYAANTKVLGCSGGALIGSLLFMPTVDLDALAVYAFLCASRARSSILGAFQLRYYVQGAFKEFAPANAHELCNNRLEVSITKMTMKGFKNLRLKAFGTFDFFLRVLLCSSNIVPLTGLPMWLRGHGLCVDGALTDIQYVSGFKRTGTFSKLHCRRKHGRKLIVVSPFYSSRADIKPSKFVPVWWCFFPPEQYKMKILFEMAQKDAKNWVKKQKKREEEEQKPMRLAENQSKTTSSPEAGGSGGSADDDLIRRSTSIGSGSADSDDDDDDDDVEMKDSLETLIKDSSRNSSQNSLQDWYTEAQEWASQTSEFAAKRAAAAKAAAEKAAKKHSETWTEFVEREKMIMKSFWFSASATAEEAVDRLRHLGASSIPTTPMKKGRRISSNNGVREEDEDFHDANEKSGGYDSESSRRSFDGFIRENAHEAFATVGKGTIKVEKVFFQVVACIIVYIECALQAAFYFILALVSSVLRFEGNEKNWEKFYSFAKPMPRLLMHPIPGIPKNKKVDDKTSKILGNTCLTYRLLCYLIHAPTEHYDTIKVSGYETNSSGSELRYSNN